MAVRPNERMYINHSAQSPHRMSYGTCDDHDGDVVMTRRRVRKKSRTSAGYWEAANGSYRSGYSSCEPPFPTPRFPAFFWMRNYIWAFQSLGIPANIFWGSQPLRTIEGREIKEDIAFCASLSPVIPSLLGPSVIVKLDPWGEGRPPILEYYKLGAQPGEEQKSTGTLY